MLVFATIDNERQGRPAKKGGNEFIRITLTAKNRYLGMIEARFKKLDGKLNTSDLAEVLYFKPGEEGYRVIHEVEIPKGKTSTSE